jgi:ketopantoate reductase
LTEKKTPHIAFVGCGAVGGYTAGHLARSGVNVTFIDPWIEHIEAIRRSGVRLTGIVRRIERGEVSPSRAHILPLITR